MSGKPGAGDAKKVGYDPASHQRTLSAFAARVGVADLKPDSLLQSVTHKSFEGAKVPNNERLQVLGNDFETDLRVCVC